MGRQSFGTIDKRGTTSKPRYRARFDDPTYTGPGRAPRISAPHTFPTKREAEIWLAAQWSAIAAGTWEHPAVVAAREAEEARQQSLKGLTVSDWANTWLADREHTAAAGTLRKRRSDLRRHILPFLGEAELADLTSADLSTWWHTLDATPGARRNAYETMRALLNAAVADDRTLLATNPLIIKGGAREARTRQKYLYSSAEVAALAAEMPARYRALIVLLADAGLRINEALALTQSSLVEREDGGMSVRVEQSLHRAGAPSGGCSRARGDHYPGGHVGRLARAAPLLGDSVRAGGGDDARADDPIRLVRSGDGCEVPAIRRRVRARASRSNGGARGAGLGDRTLRGLALGEGVVSLGVAATCPRSKMYLPAFKPEGFGDSLDLACGGGAPTLKDIAEPCELYS